MFGNKIRSGIDIWVARRSPPVPHPKAPAHRAAPFPPAPAPVPPALHSCGGEASPRTAKQCIITSPQPAITIPSSNKQTEVTATSQSSLVNDLTKSPPHHINGTINQRRGQRQPAARHDHQPVSQRHTSASSPVTSTITITRSNKRTKARATSQFSLSRLTHLINATPHRTIRWDNRSFERTATCPRSSTTSVHL